MLATDLIRAVEQAGGHLEPDGGDLVVEAPEPSSYDPTRDDEELRKIRRQVNALAAKKRKRGGMRS